MILLNGYGGDMKYIVEEIMDGACWLVWKGNRSDGNLMAECETREKADLVRNALNAYEGIDRDETARILKKANRK